MKTGYDTFLSDERKDSKNSAQYIKVLEISAYHVPKHKSNGSTLQEAQQREVGLKKAHMMTLCFPWTELPRWLELQRKEWLGLSNVPK